MDMPLFLQYLASSPGPRIPRRLPLWGSFLVAGVLLPAQAQGQGWVEPTRPGQGWGVERVGSEVRVEVEGRVARVEVTEWFRNSGPTLAEGHYLYPLPGEASFSSFSLFAGEEELRGETLDAAEARSIYEGIVARLRDPALIELAGQGLLRARVFPIQPGETRQVILRYEQLLGSSGGGLRFVYTGGVPALGSPIRAEPGPVPVPEPQPGPRPHAGTAPQGWEWGERPGGGPHFQMSIRDGNSYLDPFSPTHRVAVSRQNGRIRVVSAETLEGNFTLILPQAGERVGLTLATHRLQGEDGWVMLALSPGTAQGATPEPRDLTVVLDVSGSMHGMKMDQARGALHQLLGSLGAGDRFRLVAYNAAVRSFRQDWSDAAGAHLEEARRWVDALRAEGGTNISGALEEAFRIPPGEGQLPMVIFLTDGLPTVGERDPHRIAAAAEAARGRARVFAFGVGYDVNTQLLDALAAAGRGSTAYVQPGEDVETAVGELATRIRHPVLTDLTLVEAPVRIQELYPVTIPDLFAGEELLLLARYEARPGDVEGEVVIQGRRAGRTERFQVRATFPVESPADAWLPRLWASRKLGHLSRQARIEGTTESLVEEIRELALRYGLVSEYTSYLVVEPGMVAGEPVRPGALRMERAAAPAAPSGAGAVQAAEAARLRRDVRSAADLMEAESRVSGWAEEGMGRDAVRRVAGRTFLFQDGVWRDAAITVGTPVVRVAPGSRGWFRILEQLTELREPAGAFPAVALGGRGITLEFVEGGVEELSGAELRTVLAGFR